MSGSQKKSKKPSRPGTIDPDAIIESADEELFHQNTFGNEDERKQMNITT